MAIVSATLVIGGASLRSFAVGFIAVVLGFLLVGHGLSEVETGLVVGAGLAGMAFGTLLATLFAERFGRRNTIVAVCGLMAIGGLGLATSHSTIALGLAAFFGMLNGMGRDRGAAQVVDQAMLAGLSSPDRRTTLFSRYSLFTDIGTAAGAFAAGLVAGSPNGTAAPVIYAAIILISALPYLRVPVTPRSVAIPAVVALSPESRRRIARFAGLSTLDSLGGGFITRALLAYWFVERFDAAPVWVGVLFGAASLVNASSYGAAAWAASRVGLVNTMVFTHIPSSILLMLVPFAPSFEVAGAMFLLREFFAPMDVPTRQSYLASIVRDEERVAAAGFVNLARNASWAVGPSLAGWAMGISLAAPLIAAGVLKITYDLLLWRSFRHIRPA